VIGFLSSVSPDRWAGRMRAFHQGLSETGYAEDRNVAIEFLWANVQRHMCCEITAALQSGMRATIDAPTRVEVPCRPHFAR
jgi:putative tryptophan/tyrosine transport system substrate-binding protein